MSYERSALVQSKLSRLIATSAMVFFFGGASACGDAQSREAPESEPYAGSETETPPTVPAGTSMTFSIQEEVSTGTHEPGSVFTATLRSSVADVGGTPILAEGTPSRWVVTQSTVQDGQALLAVRLEAIRAGDAWLPVVGTVTEADVIADEADSGAETAAKIGVGAAAGALIGQIIGQDTESTLAGAGVGAAVGTAVALTTRSGSATLPIGSTVTVELDEPLILSGADS